MQLKKPLLPRCLSWLVSFRRTIAEGIEGDWERDFSPPLKPGRLHDQNRESPPSAIETEKKERTGLLEIALKKLAA